MELKYFNAYDSAWVMALAKSNRIDELYEIAIEQGVPPSLEAAAVKAIDIRGQNRDYSHIVEFVYPHCCPRVLAIMADRLCPGDKHVLRFVYKVILSSPVSTRAITQARIALSFAGLDLEMLGFAKTLVTEYLDDDFYAMAAGITAAWEQYLIDDIDDSDNDDACVDCTERVMRDAYDSDSCSK